ncbi:uncharacterized protein [Narcine bancroftii]|uniref:uncharacterized protein n=1 Tax=Narcine bancroftii TaxID=1343680 RepID=UPI003831A812
MVYPWGRSSPPSPVPRGSESCQVSLVERHNVSEWDLHPRFFYIPRSADWSHRGLWFWGLADVRGSQGRFPAPGTGGLGPDLARTVAHSPSLPQDDPRLTVTGLLIRQDAALQREPMPPHCRCPT